MRSTMLRAAHFTSALATVSLWASGVGLVLMTVFITWQVFGRFVLNDTPTWTESISVIIMGWFIFLGAAVGIREGYHLSFDVLLHVLPKPVRKVLHTVSDMVVIAFGGGMAGYGLQLAQQTWSSTIPNVGWPVGVTYLALVFGGFLMVLFSIERILRRFAGLSTVRFADIDNTDGD